MRESSFDPDMMATRPSGVPALREQADLRLVAALGWCCLALGVVRRLIIDWHAPMWLDETFTGVIVAHPTYRGLIAWCLQDPSGPVYYSLVWLWTKLAGISNHALRVPSLACALAAPALILWRGHPDRRTRLVWASVCTLWLPGLYYATEARLYSFLFLLAVGQTILFCRLMRAPDRGRALAWASLSAVMVLTHYHALVITGVQGLVYLAVHRRRALATWPAVLAFAPVAAWMSIHLSFVLGVTRPDTAWFPLLTPAQLRFLPNILFGAGMPAALLLVAVVCSLLWRIGTTVRRGRFPAISADGWTGLTGAAAIAVVLIMAMLRPTFTPRYLMPYAPAMLFGLAIWARSFDTSQVRTSALTLCLFLAVGAAETARLIFVPTPDIRYGYNFEQPSRFLAARGAKRMLFLWDHPATAAMQPTKIGDIGGFFLRRDRLPVAIEPIVLAGGPIVDPNRVLPARANRAGDGILWAYDSGVTGTLGAHFPARIQTSRQWDCRNFGATSVTVLACIRHSEPKAR